MIDVGGLVGGPSPLWAVISLAGGPGLYKKSAERVMGSKPRSIVPSWFVFQFLPYTPAQSPFSDGLRPLR